MKVLTLLIILVFPIISSAQLFQLDFEDTTVNIVSPVTTDFTGIFTSSSTINEEFSMKIYDVIFPSGWTFQMCDPQICHPIGTGFSNFLMLPNSAAILYVKIIPGSVYGTGTLKVEISDDNSSYEEIRTLQLSIGATAIEANVLSNSTIVSESWSDLAGKKYDKQPTLSGLYIHIKRFSDCSVQVNKIVISNY